MTERYKSLGQRIEELARARGDEVAAPFRERYLGLPFSAALRNDEIRVKVVQALVALDREVEAAL